ncbi:T9SS type A sorting domain-containing protein [Aquimarina sediminis]|uniref:T9SS type A sorting domain-containing protein n=1 Tax=Aquimarina sediminis TaxID=2070536 RepID=UPI000CA073CB|nr:T9SS type A sorting domain-containing protein [Aquimarina sediminis]
MKKKYSLQKQWLLCAIISLCFVIESIAQPDYRWAHSINEITFGGQGVSYGEGINMDTQGNIISTGFSLGNFDFDPSPTNQIPSNGDNSANIYIQKLDAGGNYIWHRYYSNNSTNFGNAVATDNNDNIYVVGTFSAKLPFSSNVTITSNGSSDAYVLKLDPNGNVLWARNFGLSGYDEGNDIFYNKKTNELYITGTYETTQLSSSITKDSFLYKLDPVTGNDIWVRTYGSYRNESGNGVAGDDLGNVYITGTYFKKLDYRSSSASTINNLLTAPSGEGSNAFILKINNAGNVIWAKGINRHTEEKYRGATGIAIAIDGNRNVYVTGNFNTTIDFDPGTTNFTASNQGHKDTYIVSLTTLGNFRWFQRIVGSTTTAYDRAETIAIDNQNGVLTGGITSTGGLFISRHATANGNLDWIHKGGEGDVGGIVVGTCNQIYATGGLYSNIGNDFDPDSNTTVPLSVVGHTNAFNLAWGSATPPVLDPSFTYEVCSSTLMVRGVNQPTGANPNSDWYLIEYFPGTSTEIIRDTIYWWQQPAPYVYNTNPITFNYQLQWGKFYYVKHGMYLNDCSPWKEARKYGIKPNNLPCPENFISEVSKQKNTEPTLSNQNEIKIFPNPTNRVLNLKVENIEITSYSVLDLSGKRILEKKYRENVIDVSDLTSGNYILKINTATKTYFKRFIKK